MARVVKEHDERKAEILETAERLFLEHGYEETPVELIIKEIGIAKGTFYYYFRTKNELLDTLVDKLIDEVTSTIKKLTEEEGGDALIKMFRVSSYFRTLAVGKERLTDYIHEEKNAHIHLKIEKRVTPPLVDCYFKLIEQGMKEGIFNVKYPRDTALAMVGAAEGLSEGHHDHANREKIGPRKLLAAFDIYERMLGVREGLMTEYMEKIEGGK
ncbi:MAG: TetR/AcrR family transcriptional regulator [Candidatus Thermoplasmatota archaeon]|nr:TetR/AcrR family transcriptional regulator [Candidatus Thermoplasmatota archaeon]